ncbi:probable inactive shikimate kinase like 1, chloroplastic isoform X1 [Vigna radiata var. radiata]|uniref:Probable inactive shikimate kinase like 1, chloroplastic isoform X1 n=1 Tax=Vigna radiata var. radiata TaxID=3916 RepID=A0A1S3UEG4_VIGRR|nr:probable inactive shikimate kinase like 1, chloroplastic isoform X1 [Vigna radiata var. radiata]
MEKLSVSHMNARFALPNRSFDFLQFKHSIFFLKFPNPNQNPNTNPNLVRLRRLNCSVSDGTVPSSVGATDSSLVVKVRLIEIVKAAEVSSDLKGTSIFLVGMQSSLKAGLGKLLADALRYYYFDSDSLVEEAVGGALAAKSFRESDTKGFYESETEVLKQLSSMGRLVVCAGNGAVTSPTNLALLRHGISLWIDVPLDLVARDVKEDLFIPGSYPEVKDEQFALYDKYRAGYATADAIVSVQKVASRLGCDNLDEVTIEDLTLEALREIEKLTRVKKMIEEAARPF